MITIHLTDPIRSLLCERRFKNKTLLLITDDGGGKYSLKGGACTIGANFSMIILDKPDADYPVRLVNHAGIPLFTSNYDLTFLGNGLKLDYQNHSIRLSDDSGLLDGAVQITNGADVITAFQNGLTPDQAGC
ncbi:iron-sulfur cluster biosynthesis family protein [Lentilactobacillus parakefiri]|uniref:Fe-S cluster biosynthesis protein n=1 Tax=Lentilactobacillus parakefiri TaxID=152332 RepID=A0A269YN83_9LACO|nr:iron-sulfur cluster biosynthesis family protein [Lentilactobacillus parakefiri]PAK86701.1 Fe-S cluster biosynthesis protein [Lentilactobacillus parakefiri]PAL00155.1 Fe-S cluster biosynthesis protein [Lentilactobacillus parakefiri]TDG91472.1 hypothetical protein C5L28_002349 [Lentilactobacillus parakefiri]GAW71634.1 Fe-S cluster biosynthesis protein [Lentilactobacillus parakefiri]